MSGLCYQTEKDEEVAELFRMQLRGYQVTPSVSSICFRNGASDEEINQYMTAHVRANDINPNHLDEDGRSPLHIAARLGNHHQVRELVGRKADIGQLDRRPHLVGSQLASSAQTCSQSSKETP